MKMVGFKPGDLSERWNFSASDTGILGEKQFWVLPTRVEPMTFWPSKVLIRSSYVRPLLGALGISLFPSIPVPLAENFHLSFDRSSLGKIRCHFLVRSETGEVKLRLKIIGVQETCCQPLAKFFPYHLCLHPQVLMLRAILQYSHRKLTTVHLVPHCHEVLLLYFQSTNGRLFVILSKMNDRLESCKIL